MYAYHPCPWAEPLLPLPPLSGCLVDQHGWLICLVIWTPPSHVLAEPENKSQTMYMSMVTLASQNINVEIQKCQCHIKCEAVGDNFFLSRRNQLFNFTSEIFNVNALILAMHSGHRCWQTVHALHLSYCDTPGGPSPSSAITLTETSVFLHHEILGIITNL